MTNSRGFDYRSKGFDDNRGITYRHILVNHQLAERCVDVGIALDISCDGKNRQITHQSGQSLNRKVTWIWQNWQNYRSQVNGMPAVFTANIEGFRCLSW